MATGSYMTPIYSRSQSEVLGDLHKLQGNTIDIPLDNDINSKFTFWRNHEKNDLQKASILLNNLLNQLVAIRNQNSFSSLLNEFEDLAKEWGVTPFFKTERRKRIKRFYDELAEDQSFRHGIVFQS
ncbi:hypothetical protein TNCV_2056141 [Trichonephila clavipes]|nr:hypothetical protein TNCV_2056141 [Trichonephila clavipes]